MVLDLDEATWTRDGIRYLRPELVLVLKAHLARPKDTADLDATLPLLDPGQREVLTDYLRRHHPQHPWQKKIASSP